MVQEMRKDGRELYCGIIHDEMALRQHIEWMNTSKEFSGFINYGKVSEDSDSLPHATHALVFLVSGINVSFHMPLAYYFITEGLEGVDKMLLMTSIFKSLTNTGVKVVSSTFDGHPTNIVACEIFGCSFDIDDFHSAFPNPEDPTTFIRPIFDPAHMLKLIRNHLAKNKIFYDSSGLPIEWKYFEKLVELKDKENFVCHKMTKQHINFSQHSMKVFLAAETFSRSVAQSMKSLMVKGHPDFEHAAGTIEFIERINDLFDILNSDSQRPVNRFKSALSAQTDHSVFQFLNETSNYIRGLTLEPAGKKIIDSKIKVGFKGMIINIENVIAIYNDLVKTNKIEEFHVRRLGQCPLESFFSRCRSHAFLGFNTNPTVSQFRSLMLKILVNNEITSSTLANCSDQLNILHASSYIPATNLRSQDIFNHINEQSEDEQDDLTFHHEDLMLRILPEIENDLQASIGIAYIAGQIEKKLETNRIECNLCAAVFSENEKLNIEGFPNTIKTKIPCISTFQICKFSYKIVEPRIFKTNFKYTEIIDEILNDIHPSTVFQQSDFFAHRTHKKTLIRSIAESFLSMHLTFAAKKWNVELQHKKSSNKRVKLNIVKHFQGI